ncbi:MAG: T9SS type A sorting domain-containing protein [Bacteroidia bacterium]|nr:T9SS type A sorting domain-containing protein [Bacteroidia bacterium]MDW8347146.1 hypothetical protein [Bacteroidia bacterium]
MFLHLMKKNILLTCIIAIFGLDALLAQSTMTLSPKSQTKNTTINTNVDAVVTMVNTDTRTLRYRITASPISSIPSGSGWQVCYASYCYGGSPTLTPGMALPPAELAGNGTETLKFTYEPDVNVGTVTIKFCVYNNDNIADSSCVTATYITTNSSSIQDLMNAYKPQAQITSANPASDFVSFNYQLHPKNRNVTLLLTNAMGQVVAQQSVTDLQGVTFMHVGNLPNGVYYAYMHSQSEPVLINKVIVAR